MENFDEGMKVLIENGLDGLPTANKLWAFLCNDNEAAVSATTVKAGVTQTAATSALSVTGLSVTTRILDLGVLDWSAATVGSPKSVVVCTADPAGATKIIAMQDINGGSAIDLAAGPGVVVDDLAFRFSFFISGTTG